MNEIQLYSSCLRVVESDKDDKKEGEIDPRFWDVLMSADKKDYEKICAEFGVTNFRWMLKTLNAKKVEREEEQAKVCLNQR